MPTFTHELLQPHYHRTHHTEQAFLLPDPACLVGAGSAPPGRGLRWTQAHAHPQGPEAPVPAEGRHRDGPVSPRQHALRRPAGRPVPGPGPSAGGCRGGPEEAGCRARASAVSGTLCARGASGIRGSSARALRRGGPALSWARCRLGVAVAPLEGLTQGTVPFMARAPVRPAPPSLPWTPRSLAAAPGTSLLDWRSASGLQSVTPCRGLRVLRPRGASLQPSPVLANRARGLRPLPLP